MSLATAAEIQFARGHADACEDDDLPEAAASVRACASSAELAAELLAACQLQHQALDLLFAKLIVLTVEHTPNDLFMPSTSGAPWNAMVIGQAAIGKAEGRS